MIFKRLASGLVFFFPEVLVVFREVLELGHRQPKRPRPPHRGGEYQPGRHDRECHRVGDEPDAGPHVGAKGSQPAEHAKTERNGLNRYRGLYHLTCTVREAARERYDSASSRR
jgi:hypothetical protein